MSSPLLWECATSVKAASGANFTGAPRPAWAPLGTQRVVQLVHDRFFDEMLFFRALPNFLIQIGIPKAADKLKYWQDMGTIEDDPPLSPPVPFTDGVVSFAGYAKHSRSTHLFFTLGSQPNLGTRPWEVPVGHVVQGMDVIHGIYTGYRDKVNQNKLSPDHPGAREYAQSFPKLDRIIGCSMKGGEMQNNKRELSQQVDEEEVHGWRTSGSVAANT